MVLFTWETPMSSDETYYMQTRSDKQHARSSQMMRFKEEEILIKTQKGVKPTGKKEALNSTTFNVVLIVIGLPFSTNTEPTFIHTSTYQTTTSAI